MAIISEDYVSFEIAKLLKEKGFDWNCESKKFYPEPYYDQESPDGVYSPTLQMARKWLRKMHNLFINIEIGVGAYVWTIINTTDYVTVYVDTTVGTYEETVEVAIKYCLENLI